MDRGLVVRVDVGPVAGLYQGHQGIERALRLPSRDVPTRPAPLTGGHCSTKLVRHSP